MKELKLNEEEKNLLKTFPQTSPPTVAIFKKIFTHYIGELESVRKIDPKGNMGLQTLAAQRSLETLEEIQKVFIQETGATSTPPTNEKVKIPQYQ